MSAESERIQRKFEQAKAASVAARRQGVPVTGEMRRREAGLARQVATNRRKQAEDQRRTEAREAKKAQRRRARLAAAAAAAAQARDDRKAAVKLRKARALAAANNDKCPQCKGRGKTFLFGDTCGKCKGTGRR